jgi:hypothetical protein
LHLGTCCQEKKEKRGDDIIKGEIQAKFLERFQQKNNIS